MIKHIMEVLKGVASGHAEFLPVQLRRKLPSGISVASKPEGLDLAVRLFIIEAPI